MADPDRILPIPVTGSNGDSPVVRCPACDYRSGPYHNEQAANRALFEHLESKHQKAMVHCPACSWAHGPLDEKSAKLMALVRHASEVHRVVARPPGFPQWNEKFARSRAAYCLQRALRFEHLRDGPKVVQPGEPAVNPAAELMDATHDISMAMAALLDLVLEARTGKTALMEKPPDAAPPTP